MNVKDAIQKIKLDYNIVDYIQSNGVELKPSGASTYKGLCPFHNEKTPSFSVSEDFQNYRCFGCGASGDIISFAQETHTTSFIDTVRMLAEEIGIKLSNNEEEESKYDIRGIRAVLEDANYFYQEQYKRLPDNHPAKQEVLNRGLKVDSGLYGYSLETPNDLYKYLKQKGHSDENIRESQLVIFNDGREPWDFFHGRLMITLADYLGRPVSFTSRKLYEDDRMVGKYVNGKDSPIFHKKSNLFGADRAKQSARKKKEIIVVEGQFDQISLSEHGVENVVATSGTAFTSDHANLLRRMAGADGRIVFVMDGDSAGVDAALSIFMSEPSIHAQSYAVHLENGADPCDYIQSGNLSKLKEMISEAQPIYDFVVDITHKKYGVLNNRNRHEFASDIALYAKKTNDNFIRERMLGRTSILSAISIDSINEIYNKVEARKPQARIEQAKEVTLTPNIHIDSNNEADQLMISALALLVRMPEELIPLTPKNIHKKFRPFMAELGAIYSNLKKSGKSWRFIVEQYTDNDFALLLQSYEFIGNPKDDIEEAKEQYEFLFNKANDIYYEQFLQAKKAKAMSSIIDETDPKKIAEAMRLYKESTEM